MYMWPLCQESDHWGPKGQDGVAADPEAQASAVPWPHQSLWLSMSFIQGK